MPKPDALYILEHRAHQMKCINYLLNLVDLNMSTDADWDSVARPSVVEDKVDAYITQQMSKYHIPGCAVSVVKGGELLKLRGVWGLKRRIRHTSKRGLGLPNLFRH